MAGSGVAAGTIDFLHADRGLGQAQPRAAILLGDQGGQPAGLGQCLHKLGGITPLGIYGTEILGGKLRTQIAHRIANVSILIVSREHRDRKSTRLNSSHVAISYAVFCLKKKNMKIPQSNLYEKRMG